MAAAADRARAAYSECIAGRVWRDLHVCVPEALEAIDSSRAYLEAGPRSALFHDEAAPRLQSAAEFMGRVFALCDLTGHEEACRAVAPVIERFGGAPPIGESAP